MHFLGFPRPDGSFGVRNHILVLPASMCATTTCKWIAAPVLGAVSVDNQAGCSQSGIDLEQTLRTLAGFGLNPNVAAVLAVDLGCEVMPIDRLVELVSETSKPVERLVIQEAGGSRRAIEAGHLIFDIKADVAIGNVRNLNY